MNWFATPTDTLASGLARFGFAPAGKLPYIASYASTLEFPPIEYVVVSPAYASDAV